MAGRQVTEREFAALAFRILGVVLLLSGLVQNLVLLPSVIQSWPDLGFLSLLGFLMPLVLTGAIALPLIFHAATLVAWLFPASDKTVALAGSGAVLLRCGLALIGVWFLAGNLPYLARLAGEAIWYSESGRRAEVDPAFLSNIGLEALGSLLACVAGWVLFRYAERIARWWESKRRDKS